MHFTKPMGNRMTTRMMMEGCDYAVYKVRHCNCLAITLVLGMYKAFMIVIPE